MSDGTRGSFQGNQVYPFSKSTSSGDGCPLQSVCTGNHTNRQQEKVQLFTTVAATVSQRVREIITAFQIFERRQAVFQETLPNQQRDIQQSWPSRPEVSLSLFKAQCAAAFIANSYIFVRSSGASVHLLNI